MGGSNLKDNGSLLECEGCLRGRFVSEGVSPGKGDADFCKAQLKELELTKVLVEEVATYPWLLNNTIRNKVYHHLLTR